MTTLSEVGPGSFAEYEGIRIVIPGLITYGAAVATFRTVAPNEEASLLENPLTSIVAALAIGLLLYFMDIPARSAAYNSNQPTDFLNDEFPSIRRGELLTAYLLLLNTRMPSNTRNRALYMGSMYRIGTEMILAVAIASSTVFGAALLDYGSARDSVTVQGHRMAAAFLVIVFIASLWANLAYGPRMWLQRVTNFFVGFCAWSMLFYAIGLALIATPMVANHFQKIPLLQHRYVAVFGLSISISYWAWRYIRGRSITEADERRREPLDSPFAGFLFLVPTVLGLTMYLPGDKNVLSSTGVLISWISAAGLVIAMVVIRGHERKLHGVYRGQTRWLKDNLDEVSRFLHVESSPAQTNPQPLLVDIALAEINIISGRLKTIAKLRRALPKRR